MSELSVRRYNPDKDARHIHRIWTDSKWIDDKEMYPIVDAYHKEANVWLGEVEGEVGTVVSTSPGSFNYNGIELPMTAITGVTAGLEFRRLGLAAKATTKAICDAYERGATIATLGAFEQGYYEKLGFGNFSTDSFITFDPHNLAVSTKHRRAIRLTKEDSDRMHAARLNRFKQHGTCDLHLPATTKFEIGYHKDSISLGFETGGELTHFFLGTLKGEHGPFRMEMFVYQNADQLLELLALLKTLSDQIRIVEMTSPLGIKMQEFLEFPMRHREVTEGSKYENSTVSYSFFQARILRLEECVKASKFQGSSIQFNLHLEDPIEKYLDSEESFKGCAGDYCVELGEKSTAVPGQNSEWPSLSCTINTFTRLWSGARSASSLLATDGLKADPDLVKGLDQLIRFQELKTDWDF